MKRIFSAAVAAAVTTVVAAAQGDPIFSPSFFWSWNGRLDVGKLCSQLEDMRAHGMRNCCIHPFPKTFRPGLFNGEMEPDYLTPEYMDVFEKVARRARELGMHLYLYDEGGWPSGGACGLIAAEDKEGRFMHHEIAKGADGRVTVRKRPYPKKRAEYPSVIEKGVTERFIELTHEAYAKRIGDLFGSTVRVAFTDEPNRPTDWLDHSYGWTADFADEFKKRKGYDILPNVGRMLSCMDGSDDSLAPFRIDRQDVLADLFVERFMLPVKKWCAENRVLSGGHLNGENDPRIAPNCGFGSPLRSLRALDVPGVDVIWRQLFPADGDKPAVAPPFPRYASSAMHQNGGKYAVSETFSIFGDSVTPVQMKWVVDYQIVRGINLFVFGGGYLLDSSGQWMTLFEPHVGPPAPCWDFEPQWFRYIERTARFLSEGKAAAEVAMLYDIRGLWAGGADRQEAADRHYAVATALDRLNCDYDFIEDRQLAEAELLPDGRMKIGAMKYRAIVLPTEKWMLPAAKAKCAAFEKKGGIVARGEDLSRVPRTLGFRGKDAGAFRVAKRVDGKRTLWFVMNEDMDERLADVSFPDTRNVVRYDPDGDRFELASGDATVKRIFRGGETAVYVTGETPPAARAKQYLGKRLSLAEGWTLRKSVSHEVGDRDFVIKPCDDTPRATELGDWRPLLGERFCGKAVYRIEFESEKECAALLDIGEAKWCAEAVLNGEKLGVRFTGPFRWETRLKKGRNVLEVVVANLLANQVGHDDVRDRIAREFPPKGAYDRWQRGFDRENHDSGLFGPVVFTQELR